MLFINLKFKFKKKNMLYLSPIFTLNKFLLILDNVKSKVHNNVDLSTQLIKNLSLQYCRLKSFVFINQLY
ncbi:hypothetical protein A3H09_01115 [Candidatus Falkowbacteria bacterium RIFCSPLOWO2_12_FULL_45_13]|uniref:Uncharacterized protein n=1 Tax=Candidatus Falkowbacteria bacterium RIFCSPLOWO2_12_FULL_45_13 TaxID=1797991 RepID=A0A1F5SWE1_9BACT|nr:MAG: hypothetical protein A3H09_01115 [Candidatus Falkowbacteria bacterium RIFCSPLOWO2_12_FULL_45_13]